MGRSDWVSGDIMSHILAALTLENRLAILCSIYTGLRIGDVLDLRTERVRNAAAAAHGGGIRLTVRESKTGKNRRVGLPAGLVDDLLAIAGKIYIFESRTDRRRHRTRQAVYKDIKRAAAAFRLPKKLQVSPHTARKMYAVRAYRQSADVRKVQRLLQHSDEAVTMIYAMADELTARKIGGAVRGSRV